MDQDQGLMLLCLGLALVVSCRATPDAAVLSSEVSNHSQYSQQMEFINDFLLNKSSIANTTVAVDNNTTFNEIPAVLSSVLDTLPGHPRVPRKSPVRTRENRHSTRVLASTPARFLLPPPVDSEYSTDFFPPTEPPLSLKPIVVTSSPLAIPTSTATAETASESHQVEVKTEQSVAGPQYRRVFIPPPLRYLLPPFFYENYINAQSITTVPSAEESKQEGTISPTINAYYSSAKLPCRISAHGHSQNISSSSIPPIIVIETVSQPDIDIPAWDHQIPLVAKNFTPPSRGLSSEPDSEVEFINNLPSDKFNNHIRLSSTSAKTPTSNEEVVLNKSQFVDYIKSNENYSPHLSSTVRYSDQQQFSSVPDDGVKIGAWNRQSTPVPAHTKTSRRGFIGEYEKSVKNPYGASQPNNQFKYSPVSSSTSKPLKYRELPFINSSQVVESETRLSQDYPNAASIPGSSPRQQVLLDTPETDVKIGAWNHQTLQNLKSPSRDYSNDELQNFENNYKTGTVPKQYKFSSTTARSPQTRNPVLNSSRFGEYKPKPPTENYSSRSKKPVRYYNVQQFSSTAQPVAPSEPTTDLHRVTSSTTSENYPVKSTAASKTDSYPVLQGPNIEQALFETGDFQGFAPATNNSEDPTMSMMNRPLLAQEVAKAGMKITANLKDSISKGKLNRGRYKFNHFNQFNFQNLEDKSSRLAVAESSYYNGRRTQDLTQEADIRVIPGRPGIDYPILSSPPEGSTFSCRSVGYHRGYVADPSTGCQVFYICVGNGPGEGMLCPNGTVFSQDFLVCDWWYNVDCQPLT